MASRVGWAFRTTSRLFNRDVPPPSSLLAFEEVGSCGVRRCLPFCYVWHEAIWPWVAGTVTTKWWRYGIRQFLRKHLKTQNNFLHMGIDWLCVGKKVVLNVADKVGEFLATLAETKARAVCMSGRERKGPVIVLSSSSSSSSSSRFTHPPSHELCILGRFLGGEGTEESLRTVLFWHM